MSLAPEQIETALAKLWDAAAGVTPVGRARTVDLVAVCTTAEYLARAHSAVRALMPANPGRAIVVALDPAGAGGAGAGAGGTAVEPGITAAVELVASPAHHGVPCGEAITLTVPAAARAWVPTAVERLLSAGAPVVLWWLGDLPDDDTLYHRLTEAAQLVVINSGDMDLRDLRTLARLVETGRGAYALADLTWVRLRTWQELLARFFDDPAVLPKLARTRALTLACAPYRLDAYAEPTSTHAGLYAGWFAARIGADAARARWTHTTGDRREVVIPAPDGRELQVEFVTVARADVSHGGLVRVALATDDGARFELALAADDPAVVGWQGACADAVVPAAVLRVGPAEEAQLLARNLESPVRNTLFESSLLAAAQLLEPLYTRRGPRPGGG